MTTIELVDKLDNLNNEMIKAFNGNITALFELLDKDCIVGETAIELVGELIELNKINAQIVSKHKELIRVDKDIRKLTGGE